MRNAHTPVEHDPIGRRAELERQTNSDTDAEGTRENLLRMIAIKERLPELIIVLAHDLRAFAEMPTLSQARSETIVRDRGINRRQRNPKPSAEIRITDPATQYGIKAGRIRTNGPSRRLAVADNSGGGYWQTKTSTTKLANGQDDRHSRLR